MFRQFALSSALVLSAFYAQAHYDSTWHKATFWPGEYPTGFAVTKNNVMLPARTAINAEMDSSLQCAVPKNAVYHPWNEERTATYITMSKIVPMTVKEDFSTTLENDTFGLVQLSFKKGETIDFLIYGAEGYFTAGYKGEIYYATQELLEYLEDVDFSQNIYHLWLQIPCTNGVTAWVWMNDLVDQETGTFKIDGIDDWGPAFQEDGRYGYIRDIQE